MILSNNMVKAWHGMAWHGFTRYPWHGMAWHHPQPMAWHGLLPPSTRASRGQQAFESVTDERRRALAQPLPCHAIQADIEADKKSCEERGKERGKERERERER
jgi:hypothetical protein